MKRPQEMPGFSLQDVMHTAARTEYSGGFKSTLSYEQGLSALRQAGHRHYPAPSVMFTELILPHATGALQGPAAAIATDLLTGSSEWSNLVVWREERSKETVLVFYSNPEGISDCGGRYTTGQIMGKENVRQLFSPAREFILPKIGSAFYAGRRANGDAMAVLGLCNVGIFGNDDLVHFLYGRTYDALPANVQARALFQIPRPYELLPLGIGGGYLPFGIQCKVMKSDKIAARDQKRAVRGARGAAVMTSTAQRKSAQLADVDLRAHAIEKSA
jgi:hypothetical protein